MKTSTVTPESKITTGDGKYTSTTGPDGQGRTFSSQEIQTALGFVASWLGVEELYPEQATCLLSLFIGVHVVGLLPTSFGKTFAFLGLPILYDFLFNGDPRSRETVVFDPVIIVLSPLVALMAEHCKMFNSKATTNMTRRFAAHISGKQRDSSIFARVAARDAMYSNLHVP